MNHSTSTPKVSVIVPVYNVEKYLPDCLDSIINQTFRDIEIIVVNDGSPDNSQQIIDQYAQADSRIIPVAKTNGGLSSARNAGMQHVRGQYVLFVDSDDYIEPTTIETTYQLAQKNQLEVVCFLTKVIDTQTNAEIEEPYFNSTHLPDNISIDKFTYKDIAPKLFTMQVTAWNKLYSWDLISRTHARFPEGLHFEDNPFFTKIMLNAKHIGFATQKLYDYRVNRGGSITGNNTSRTYFEYFSIMALCEKYIREEAKWDEMKEYFLSYKISSLYHWYTQLHPSLKEEFFSLMQTNLSQYNLDQFDSSKLDKHTINTFNNIVNNPTEDNQKNRPSTKRSLRLFERLYAFRHFWKNYKQLENIKNDLHFLKTTCNSLQDQLNSLQDQLNVLQTQKEHSQRLQYKVADIEKAIEIIRSGHVENMLYSQNNPIEFSTIKDQSLFYGAIPQSDIASIHTNLNYLVKLVYSPQEADAYYLWGLNSWNESALAANAARHTQKPLYLFEDGFLRSICSIPVKDVPTKYRSGIAFTVDRKTAYFDATRPSDLEELLNTFEVSPDNIERAEKLIQTIIENKLSKYNNQTLDAPNYGHADKKKVLVIDQSYKDAAIAWGLCNEATFTKMLHDAINDNPDHEILVKIHPDTIARGIQSAYFENLQRDNVTLIYDAVNPIALLDQVDKVYVATSQLGLEALMCKKEVHTYGMPFYAGWGLTHDQLTCPRRTRNRSLAELFYIVYIQYSWYVNPETQTTCEIEDAINYLLNLRTQFFEEQL